MGGAKIAWCQEHLNGFYLTSPLSLGTGYDDNFPTDSRVLDDNVSILSAPTFAWMKSTHRSTFSVDYRPEFEIFSHYQDLNAWNHTASMRFTHRISSRWSMDGGDYFLSTMDPTRTLSNSLLLLPRGRFQENAFFTGLAYRVSRRTKLSFRFDNAFTLATLPGSLNGRLDQVSSAGTVTLDHSVGRRHRISANYSFLHAHPLNQKLSGNPTNVNLISLGYTYEINPSLTLQLYGGGVQGADSAFIGSASVVKRIRGLWLLAGYQRYLSFFGGLTPVGGAPTNGIATPDGVTPSSIYQVVSFRAWGNLTRRLSVEANAQRALNGMDRNNRTVKSGIGQVHLHYRLTDRFGFFTQVEFYGQNVNEFSPFPVSRRRYVAGIEIALSRPPRAERVSRRGTIRANQDVSAPEDDALIPEDEPRIEEDH